MRNFSAAHENCNRLWVMFVIVFGHQCCNTSDLDTLFFVLPNNAGKLTLVE